MLFSYELSGFNHYTYQNVILNNCYILLPFCDDSVKGMFSREPLQWLLIRRHLTVETKFARRFQVAYCIS